MPEKETDVQETQEEAKEEESEKESSGKTFDEDYVRDLRKENASWRAKLRDAEQKLQEHEDSQKSEVEKLRDEKQRLEKEVTESKKAYLEASLKSEVRAEAAVMGLIDPDAACKLVDSSLIDVDEDTGEIGGVKKALERLIKQKPYLIEKKEPEIPVPGAGGQSIDSSGVKNLDDAFLQMIKSK